MRKINIVLIVAGVALILHHGLTYGLWFDFNDWIGHDWLGLGMAAFGFCNERRHII